MRKQGVKSAGADEGYAYTAVNLYVPENERDHWERGGAIWEQAIEEGYVREVEGKPRAVLSPFIRSVVMRYAFRKQRVLGKGRKQ